MDEPLWGLASTKGLTLYAYAYRVALMYDWCYNAPSWDTAFRGEVSLKLREMADLIVDNGGTEQNPSPASNWQGIRGAAAAWTYLAIDDPFDGERYEKAWNRVVTYLQQNLGTSADARGWNIEGLGYTALPRREPYVVAALADSQTSLDLAISADGLTYSAYASRETSDSSKRPRLLLQEIGPPPIFEEWAAAEWPDLDSSQRAPEADANGDGIPNLLTYLVGDHSGLPRLVPASDALKIEWHRRVGFNSASWSMQWALHPAGPWTLLPADATTAISTTTGHHTLRTSFPEGVTATRSSSACR